MIQRTYISLVLLSAVLCFTASAQQSTPEASSQVQAAQDDESDLVVARVSGQPLTEKQVVSAIDQLASQQRLSLEQLQQRNDLLFKDAVENLIRIALLKNQARVQNVKVEKDKVDQQLQQISQRFPSKEDFQKALTSQGVTEIELRKNIEDSMSMQQLIDQAVKDVPETTDAEIEKFYNDNPDKFPTPEQVHAAHILLRVDPKSTPEQKAEIKKKMEAILSDIESDTIAFADAAAKYSQDPSNAAKGGDLGFFSRGRMVKPFEEAAFATKPGSLSPIIETQFGYHIIQVIESKPAGKASLEEAKPVIKQYLDQLARRKAAQKYMDELRAQATIETFMTQEEFVKRHPTNQEGEDINHQNTH
jgi:peptidyl-prolyl cis-trans isomerase C